MRFDEPLIARLQAALRDAGGIDITLEQAEIFHGPSPLLPRPSITFRFLAPGELTSSKAHLRVGRFIPGFKPPPEAAESLGVLAATVAAWLLEREVGFSPAWRGDSGPDRVHHASIEIIPGRLLSAIEALQSALLVIGADSASEAEPSVAAELQKLRHMLSRHRLEDQSSFLIAAARRHDIPVLNIGRSPITWQFGWGARSDIFWRTGSNRDGLAATRFTSDKALTKEHLKQLGLPTPAFRLLTRPENAPEAADAVGWPCVVKPLNQGHGLGVTAGIANPEQLERALDLAFKYSNRVLVEALEPGADHRLMVVEGRLIAAVRRDPPYVIGDGRRSIAELIEAMNVEREQATGPASYLDPIREDEALVALLETRGLATASVLPAGERLALRSTANRSTGGTATDSTPHIHPEIRAMAELVAVSLGLRVAGIDYITTDIGRSHGEVGGGFIEVNAMPGLGVLMAAGLPEDDIMGIVLGSKPGRIPVSLLIGSPDALATLEPHVSSAVAAAGWKKAAAGPAWAQVGGLTLPVQGLDAVAVASAPLRHATVEALALLWSRENLFQQGLPVDRAETIVLLDTELPSEWLAFIRGACRKLVRTSDPAEALEHLALSSRAEA